MMTENSVADHSLIEIRDGGGNRHEDELLASLIGEKLGQLPPSPPVPGCIFRIPSLLRRQADEENFVPSVVSIGSLHHGGNNLLAMEETKLLYVQGLLVREPMRETSLENFVKEIRIIEQDCRNCYDERFDHLPSDKFVEMMVVDGRFVIELFRKFSGEVLKHKGDPVFSNPWMHTAITTDLLLLENQLPWRVLSCLFHLTSEAGKLHLTEIILKHFEGFTMATHLQANAALEKQHFLDFLGNCLQGSSAECAEFENYSHRPSIPSVTELSQLGIFFRYGSNDVCNVRSSVMEF